MTGGLVLEIAVSLLLVAGGLFGLIGSIGLVKFSHPMTRLHAPTKASTLGVGGVLIASMLWRGGSWQELAITLFLFATAPVSALFLARVWLAREARKRDIPREWRERRLGALPPAAMPPPPGYLGLERGAVQSFGS